MQQHTEIMQQLGIIEQVMASLEVQQSKLDGVTEDFGKLRNEMDMNLDGLHQIVKGSKNTEQTNSTGYSF